ncbi:hypothetical protein HY357_03270 [Candidatus Roizmanbacteria bacterium]|nr:hypothetical protein [Candidatus Roizmanbacteria bacterium]
MLDNNAISATSQKLHPRRISELNFELIQTEKGEMKLALDKIVNNVMEVVYFKALEEGERSIVDLDIARVYKRGFLAAQKCGFNIKENASVISFFLDGFQQHINRYIKSQQKALTQTLDVS